MTDPPAAAPLPPEDAALLERLVAARLERAPAALRRWYDRTELERALRDELREGVAWLRDEAFGRTFAANCPVPGTAPTDYLNRRLVLPLLGEALVGIRFRGLDLNRPFVEVVASERQLGAGDDPGALAGALREAFAGFAPKHVSMYQPRVEGVAQSELAGAFRAGAFWDLRWLAAPTAQLRAEPLGPGAERLRLERPTDLAFYPEYRAILEARFAQTPELREYTHAETERDLEAYRREGTLFVVRVDGRRAGLVAATRAAARGMRGFLMIEIVLAPWAGGQGLGAPLLLRLARALPERRGDALFGTIHAANAPALRAALRAGRVDVGGDLWLPL